MSEPGSSPAPRGRSGLIAQLRVRRLLRRTNGVLRILIGHAAAFSYRRKMRAVRRASPALFAPLEAGIEARHAAYWRPLARSVDPSWLRFFANLSGIADPRYVPQDVFHRSIERRLNDLDFAELYADKNLYERWFDPGLFPRTLLRRMSGNYLDRDYTPLTRQAFADRFASLDRDCFVKVSLGSGGGRRVERLRREDGAFRSLDGSPFTVEDLERRFGRHYIVQEILRPHPDLARFNPDSVNTLRVVTYRSVRTEKVVPLRAVLRIGRKSMIVDNQARGGLACGVRLDGSLEAYATSKIGRKFTRHPDSEVAFEGARIPRFDVVLEAVTGMAARVPPLRLLSFDVTVDESGSVRIVEVNTRNVEINFLQTSGGPLFGEHSDEVVEWCAEHPEHDGFRVIRLG